MTEEVVSLGDIKALEAWVIAAAKWAAAEIRATGGSGIEFLRRLKFEACGRHPLKDQPLNVIEQVNQTFTYLVTLRAAEMLLVLHPEVGALRLNLGTASGTDIEDVERKLIAAEVFAAVDPNNNKKLRKDIDRLVALDVPHRYVFFAAPGYEGRQPSLERTNVQVWAVDLFAAAAAAPVTPPTDGLDADPDGWRC